MALLLTCVTGSETLFYNILMSVRTEMHLGRGYAPWNVVFQIYYTGGHIFKENFFYAYYSHVGLHFVGPMIHLRK